MLMAGSGDHVGNSLQAPCLRAELQASDRRCHRVSQRLHGDCCLAVVSVSYRKFLQAPCIPW